MHPGRAAGQPPCYFRIRSAARRARARGDRALARELRVRQRSLPSSDPRDPGYRRLRMSGSDDALLGSPAESRSREIRSASLRSCVMISGWN